MLAPSKSFLSRKFCASMSLNLTCKMTPQKRKYYFYGKQNTNSPPSGRKGPTGVYLIFFSVLQITHSTLFRGTNFSKAKTFDESSLRSRTLVRSTERSGVDFHFKKVAKTRPSHPSHPRVPRIHLTSSKTGAIIYHISLEKGECLWYN